MTALDEAADRLAAIVSAGQLTPGAVLRVEQRGAIVLERAVGYAQDHDGDGPLDEPRPVRPDTVFDVASLTKVLTTAALMRLVDRAAVGLDTPVGALLGELAEPGAPPTTLDHLLTHRGGLPAWQPTYLFTSSAAEALRWIQTLPRPAPPGRERRYSDLGFMLLGAAVERLTDETLDAHLERTLLAPLGMADSRYAPPPGWRSRIAATSTGNRTERRMIAAGEPEPVAASPADFAGWRTHTLVGEVNDGNAAHTFDGVAGHAGAFSTAADLATLGTALLDALAGRNAPWSPGTVRAFLDEPYDRGQARGWWTRRLDDRRGGFGHRGFTGCELSVIPELETVVVLLTNRLHTERDPPPDHGPVWRDLLTATYATLAR